MKQFLPLMLLAFQIGLASAAEDVKPCPNERSAICAEAELLAQKLKEASGRIEDIVIRVDVDQWTIIYREISNQTPFDASPEAVAGWASKVQRKWCSASSIADFVHRGGEFLYRLENGSGEVLAPTLLLKCQ